MMKRRGQATGSQASILILVILLLIIFYILFLPQKEREELLGEDNDRDGSTSRDRLPKGTLLDERDLSLSPYRTMYDKDLPNVYLFEIKNAKELASLSPFTIKRSIFSKEFRNFTFAIEELNKTENVILSFRIREAKGILKIVLNGYTIYDYGSETGDIDPISINKLYLKEINEIEFSVSGVGGRFWKSNKYSIEQPKIIGDISDISRQKSENVFILTGSEYDNTQSARLQFLPDCAKGKVGILDISINERKISSSVPECGVPQIMTIPVGILEEGNNYALFTTTKGTYNLQDIRIEIDYKEAEKWRFHFDIDDDEYDDIKDGRKDAILKIDFEDDDNNKADFKINGHRDDFDEDDDYFEQDISRWIEEGDNTIIIDPSKDFEIDRLRIVLD